MRRVARLALVSLLALPAIAHAQSNGREFSSQPSPPPLPHSAQNPSGGSALQPSPPPLPPPPPGPAKPRPGGNARHGLVGYRDVQVQAGPGEIEPPVTGYGNEALWDVGGSLDTPPAADALGTPPSSTGEGSTAGAPNR